MEARNMTVPGLAAGIGVARSAGVRSKSERVVWHNTPSRRILDEAAPPYRSRADRRASI